MKRQGGMMIGVIIGIIFYAFVEPHKTETCTPSNDTQAIQAHISGMQEQINYNQTSLEMQIGDMSNSVDVLLQQSEILKCK